MSPLAFKTQILVTNIYYKNKPIPVLRQNEPYTYLEINLVPSVKLKIQIHTTTTKVLRQCKDLIACQATMKQKMNMANTVIRAGMNTSSTLYRTPYLP